MLNKPEENVDTVDVAAVEPDRVRRLRVDVLECQEVVGHLRRTGHLWWSLQTQNQQVQHQTVVLHDEWGELQTSDDTVTVCVVHVL